MRFRGIFTMVAKILGAQYAWAKKLIKEHEAEKFIEASVRHRAEKEPETPPPVIEEFSPSFIKARTFTEAHEGGYGDVPDDRGGETKFGISKRSYPELNIRKLTRKQAREIYKRDYWDKIRGDELPEDVARVVFDMAINAGVGTASKHLQLAIDAPPDGVIGNKTLRRLDAHLRKEDPYTLAKKLLEKRRWYYARLMSRDPSQTKFGLAWARRVNMLEEALDREEGLRRQAVVNNIAKNALKP
jgi:lysozyme family protein